MIKPILFSTTTLLSLVVLTTPILSFANHPHITAIKNPIVANTPEDEAKVTDTIKKEISTSKTLSHLNIEVSTSKGVVTFKGDVESESQVISLVELAEMVIGVKDVNTSELKVKGSSQPLADSVTTAKIKGLFIREDLFGEKDINSMETSVETKDGIVYLTGTIDNQEQIDNAIKLIKDNVPEVKKVIYNMKKVTPVNQ